MKPFVCSGRLLGASWAFLALLVYNGGARKTIHSSKKKQSSLDGTALLARGPLAGGLPLALNPGPSRPDPGIPRFGLKKALVGPPRRGLARRALGSGGQLAVGSGAFGGLGPGFGWGPWLGGPLALVALWARMTQNHKIEQPACLDPWPASWSRNPANPEPRLPEPKFYALGSLKVVWVPAIP